MSHDTHEEHSNGEHGNAGLAKSKTALTSSFWLIVIIAGLFIAALNFISAMSHDDAEGHDAHSTETLHHEAAPAEFIPHGQTNHHTSAEEGDAATHATSTGLTEGHEHEATGHDAPAAANDSSAQTTEGHH